jgi:hypothetical protein
VIDIALEAAVGEPRRDFSHVTLLDRLAAQRAERPGAGGSTIHQDELHVAPPHATQNSVRRLRSLDGAARGSYCHQALRLGLIPFLAPVLAQPVGNKPAPDEKSAQKVHYGASVFGDTE